MKREELSRIASVKFKKAITDCSHAVSHRVLAFCVMAACLVFTLAVTAANLRLTYVTDSHGARQVVLTSAESDTARVMNLSGIEAEEGDNVYYTAFSGNLASLNIERAFAVSIQADGQEYSVKMAVGTVADALERAGLPYRCRGAEDTFFTHRIVCDVCDILRFAAAPDDTERFLRIYYKFGAMISREAALAACDEARLNYEQKVLAAFREVNDAVVTYRNVRTAAALKRDLQQAAQKYVELAQLQYFNGVINYLDVLDAQRKYFDAQIGLSNAVRDEHLAMVDLYKALGGGWGVERE